MGKKTPSPAFLAARELAKQVSKMTDAQRDELVSRMAAPATIEGRALSARNSIMLYTQLQRVTVVGGFRQWLKAGRSVAKGSSALWIYAPSPYKVTVDGETKEELRFRLVPVFDVSQTETAAA